MQDETKPKPRSTKRTREKNGKYGRENAGDPVPWKKSTAGQMRESFFSHRDIRIKKFNKINKHLFLFCPWTAAVWAHPSLHIRINSQGFSRIEEWLLAFHTSPSSAHNMDKIAFILCGIWKTRNQAIFQHKKPNPHQVIEIAQTDLCSYAKWNPKTSKASRIRGSQCKEWVPPPEGVLKINTDGSYIPGATEGAVACVCRNSAGVLIGGSSRTVAAFSASAVEALANFGVG